MRLWPQLFIYKTIYQGPRTPFITSRGPLGNINKNKSEEFSLFAIASTHWRWRFWKKNYHLPPTTLDLCVTLLPISAWRKDFNSTMESECSTDASLGHWLAGRKAAHRMPWWDCRSHHSPCRTSASELPWKPPLVAREAREVRDASRMRKI